MNIGLDLNTQYNWAADRCPIVKAKIYRESHRGVIFDTFPCVATFRKNAPPGSTSPAFGGRDRKIFRQMRKIRKWHEKMENRKILSRKFWNINHHR